MCSPLSRSTFATTEPRSRFVTAADREEERILLDRAWRRGEFQKALNRISSVVGDVTISPSFTYGSVEMSLETFQRLADAVGRARRGATTGPWLR